MRAIITVSLLLLLTTAAIALAPPDVEWEKTFGTAFYDVWETIEGNYAVGARDSLFLTDSNGNIIWSTTATEVDWYYVKFQVVLPLSAGGFIATGVGKEQAASSYSIPIIRLTNDGDLLWSKSYGYTEFTEYAYGAAELPDGGCAIAARKGGTAWILRTDAQGDTLWTREWSYTYSATAVNILYHDNGLLVFAQGNTPTTPLGPHLLRYDMDGNLLWETNFPDWPGPVTPEAEAMCEASDGGLLLMDNYWPAIMHTDYEGNPDWWFGPPSSTQPYGYSIATTMDGGIIYGGQNTPDPDVPGSQYSGMITRHDSSGNELWRDYVYNSGCAAIYSVRQLAQGGYIAAGYNGNQGFLIKYAPELGFESQEGSPTLTISSISPNPFSAATEIQFSLVEAGDANLTVFDLNGRVVDVLGEGVFAEGEHTIQWAPEGIASGCYMVRLTTEYGSAIENMVLIK